jgi:dTDP-4-dehydrorhamnose 3,5-epimerase
MENSLRCTETKLSGLYVLEIPVHGDVRGSFREAYQAEKMEALGLPKLGPVQWNISTNTRAGIVRGIHAEPWDKFIHCISGRAFAAIVDVRRTSPTFGQHLTFELDQAKALYVSKGFGNAYQTLEPNTVYGYLVNAHWRAGERYPAIHYADPKLGIAWPMPIGADDVSEKDKMNPTLDEYFAANASKI